MDRRTVILAGLATVAGAALSGPAGARRRPPRQAAGATPAARRRGGGLAAGHSRTRIVTRTFTSTGPIAVPALPAAAASPYPSTIPVRGLRQGRILKVRVTFVGVTHPVPSHLDVLLVAPGNIGVILMSDAGGGHSVTGITLTFDQDAAHRLPDALRGGTFQPTNLQEAVDPFPAPAPQGITGHSLTRFTNRNPNGRWRLFVVNDGPYDGGSLAGWSLQIRARVRLPRRQRRRGR